MSKHSSPDIIRVLILSYGASAGKTSLIRRFTQNVFEQQYQTTTSDILSKRVLVDGEVSVIQIIDTPGDPFLSGVSTEAMKFADAFMVVYDTSEVGALNSCVSLRFSIIQEKQVMNPPIVLVGAKSDLKACKMRKASVEAIARIWECPIFETSAKLNVNVDEAFVGLVRQYRSRRRVLVHEDRSSSLISNIFPRLRAWNSTETYGRALKCGWIHKRGFVVTNWKLRHLVLYDDGSLQYYENDGAQDDCEVSSAASHVPLGELNLRDVSEVSLYREDGHENAFILHTKNRDWYFSSLDEMEKNAWIDIIVRWMAEFSSRNVRNGLIEFGQNEEGEDLDDRRVSFTMLSESDAFFEERLAMAAKPSLESQTINVSNPRSELVELGMDSIIECEEVWD